MKPKPSRGILLNRPTFNSWHRPRPRLPRWHCAKDRDEVLCDLSMLRAADGRAEWRFLLQFQHVRPIAD